MAWGLWKKPQLTCSLMFVVAPLKDDTWFTHMKKCEITISQQLKDTMTSDFNPFLLQEVNGNEMRDNDDVHRKLRS